MTHPELPKLPKKPKTSHAVTVFADGPHRVPAWTNLDLEDYARDYGAACYRAGLLKAAGIAEKLHDPQDDGWEACLNEVAAAIRKEAAEP